MIINDSHGRAFRNGTVGVAIGASGIPALADLRGAPDLFGRKLHSTEVALADEIASAASLLMGQAGEGRPIVLARGLVTGRTDGAAADLVRPKSIDLFRPASLDDRLAEQALVLDRGAPLVRVGGRLVYVTCSVLPPENDGAVSAFLARRPDFASVPPREAALHAGLDSLSGFVSAQGLGLQLTPRRTGTDGFYVAVLKRIR